MTVAASLWFFEHALDDIARFVELGVVIALDLAVLRGGMRGVPVLVIHSRRRFASYPRSTTSVVPLRPNGLRHWRACKISTLLPAVEGMDTTRPLPIQVRCSLGISPHFVLPIAGPLQVFLHTIGCDRMRLDVDCLDRQHR